MATSLDSAPDDAGRSPQQQTQTQQTQTQTQQTQTQQTQQTQTQMQQQMHEQDAPAVHRTQFLRRQESLSNMDPSSTSWMSVSLSLQQQQQPISPGVPSDSNGVSAYGRFGGSLRAARSVFRSPPSSPDRLLSSSSSSLRGSMHERLRNIAPAAVASADRPCDGTVLDRRQIWSSRSLHASSLALATSSPPSSPKRSNGSGNAPSATDGHAHPRWNNASPPVSPAVSVRDRLRTFERLATTPVSPPVATEPRRNPFLRRSSLSSDRPSDKAVVPKTPLSPASSDSITSSSSLASSSASAPPCRKVVANNNTNTSSNYNSVHADAVAAGGGAAAGANTATGTADADTTTAAGAGAADTTATTTTTTAQPHTETRIEIDNLPLEGNGSRDKHDRTGTAQQDDDLCNSGEFSIATDPTDDEQDALPSSHQPPPSAPRTSILRQHIRQSANVSVSVSVSVDFDDEDDVLFNPSDLGCDPRTLDNFETIDAMEPVPRKPIPNGHKAATTGNQGNAPPPVPRRQQPLQQQHLVPLQTASSAKNKQTVIRNNNNNNNDGNDWSTSNGSDSFEEWILRIDHAFDEITFSSVSSGSYREPPRKQTSYRIQYNGPTTLNLDRFASSEDRFASGEGTSYKMGIASTASGDAAPAQPSRRSVVAPTGSVQESTCRSTNSKLTVQTRPDVWITPKARPQGNDVASIAQLSWRVQRVWKDLSPDMVQALPRRTRDRNENSKCGQRTVSQDSIEEVSEIEDAANNTNADSDHPNVNRSTNVSPRSTTLPAEHKSAVPDTKAAAGFGTSAPWNTLEDLDDEDYDEESSVNGEELFNHIRTLVGAPVRQDSSKSTSMATSPTLDETYATSSTVGRDDAPKLPQRSWRMQKFFDEDGEWYEDDFDDEGSDDGDDDDDDLFCGVMDSATGAGTTTKLSGSGGRFFDDAQFEANMKKVHRKEQTLFQRDTRREQRRRALEADRAERMRKRMEAPTTPRRSVSPTHYHIPENVGRITVSNINTSGSGHDSPVPQEISFHDDKLPRGRPRRDYKENVRAKDSGRDSASANAADAIPVNAASDDKRDGEDKIEKQKTAAMDASFVDLEIPLKGSSDDDDDEDCINDAGNVSRTMSSVEVQKKSGKSSGRKKKKRGHKGDRSVASSDAPSKSSSLSPSKPNRKGARVRRGSVNHKPPKSLSLGSRSAGSRSAGSSSKGVESEMGTPTTAAKQLLSPREVNLKFGGTAITDSSDSSSSEDEKRKQPVVQLPKKKKKRKKKVAPRNNNLIRPADVNRLMKSRAQSVRNVMSSVDDSDSDSDDDIADCRAMSPAVPGKRIYRVGSKRLVSSSPTKSESRRSLMADSKMSRRVKQAMGLGDTDNSGDNLIPLQAVQRVRPIIKSAKQKRRSKSTND